jgi:lipopolysaccharide export system protein LptC
LSFFLSFKQNQTLNTIASPSNTTPQKPQGFIYQSKVYSMNTQGELKYYLSSDKTHYYLKQQTWLDNPRLEIYQDQQKAPWKIQAKIGWVNKEGDQVLLQGQTIIERKETPYNQFIHLQTEDLLVFPQKQTAQTQKWAKIRGKNVIMEGIGMQADLKNNQLQLLSQVWSQYEVK